MTTRANLQVECEQHHTSLPVSDVRTAADFYTKKLGFTAGASSSGRGARSYFARFSITGGAAP